MTFGNPDSRFTTQIDFDRWKVNFQKSDYLVRTNPITVDPATYRIGKQEYTGMGLGIFERYRAIDLSNSMNAYLLGGIGGYFLDYQHEESNNGTVSMTAKGLHSLAQLSGGIGFEAKVYQGLLGFVEGRYTAFLSTNKRDNNLMNGYFGFRYVF